MSDLRRLQEWLRAAITDPDGAGTARSEAESVVRSTPRLGAAQRLELYRRSYHLRLLEAMRASYPGLRHMLGAELFDDFALDYLRARPSRSYTLQRLGEGFADHLAATRPDADAADEGWPNLMIDLARLELTFAEVYDAPGSEGGDLPGPGSLPAAPDATWLAATVEPVPCLRLVRSCFPAGPYLSAVRRGERPPLPEPCESFVAVSRRDYVVTLTPLGEREHALLERLLGGAAVGDAAAGAGVRPSEAWRTVRAWAGAAFFESLQPAAKECVTR
ncbi:MAG TPA: DNA-binding domain-containing protein [Thermoleophilaceae bacterium]